MKVSVVKRSSIPASCQGGVGKVRKPKYAPILARVASLPAGKAIKISLSQYKQVVSLRSLVGQCWPSVHMTVRENTAYLTRNGRG